MPVRERVLGAEHPDTLTVRHDLARWTGEAGDAIAARDQLRDLLPSRERVLGAAHPHTADTRRQLAYWRKQAQRKEGLITMLRARIWGSG
ncbi:tetratricopeptide repeat protein [Nonomuraea dietziae]|uniref:tetratricopeptide repeat protein n=1 Tax=Nonomuraea dietziae TaxID=65515 RepID=UPI0036117446